MIYPGLEKNAKLVWFIYVYSKKLCMVFSFCKSLRKGQNTCCLVKPPQWENHLPFGCIPKEEVSFVTWRFKTCTGNSLSQLLGVLHSLVLRNNRERYMMILGSIFLVHHQNILVVWFHSKHLLITSTPPVLETLLFGPWAMQDFAHHHTTACIKATYNEAWGRHDTKGFFGSEDVGQFFVCLDFVTRCQQV